MKYMLLIYTNEASKKAIAENREAIGAEVDAFMAELIESGELIGGQALADPVNARTVKVRGGVPVITDGPFLEAKEYLAGTVILECDSLERATAIAQRWPDARYCAMEVWPVMDEAGLEM